MSENSMTASASSDSILIEQQGRLGILTLNLPKALNALNRDMIDRLQGQLDAWRDDDSIQAVWLQGTGDKAFCAGGDIRKLYESMVSTPAGSLPDYALDFFTREYRLDYTIHRYPKPIIAWGDGIVMGGGIGIMGGASHRVVTERSLLAMPEVSIGLYPDVGASWFFNRMPGQLGRFLGMTGVRLNGPDAIFAKLADRFIQQERKQAIMQALAAEDALNAATVSALLRQHEQASVEVRPESPLRQHFDPIQTLMDADSVPAIAANFRPLAQSREPADKWLGHAAKGLLKGCPVTPFLVDEQIKRARYGSLADAFRQELIMSTQCAMHPDLPEGIRALLIDKDGQPRWQFATVNEVPADYIAEHFQPPWEGPHPLADLD